MINKIVFPTIYRFELPDSSSLETVSEHLSPNFFLMKEDPYYGIDSKIWARINTKYMCYREKEKIFFYYSRAFIEGQHSGKSIFPYFKGNIEIMDAHTKITGRIKYHGLTSFLLPVILLGLILLVFLLKISSFFYLIPALLALIILISAKNIEEELVNDLNLFFKKIRLKNDTTANNVQARPSAESFGPRLH